LVGNILLLSILINWFLNSYFHILGPDNIEIVGKAIILPGAILRGDLALVTMGEYVIIKEDVIIRPTYAKNEGKKRLTY